MKLFLNEFFNISVKYSKAQRKTGFFLFKGIKFKLLFCNQTSAAKFLRDQGLAGPKK